MIIDPDLLVVAGLGMTSAVLLTIGFVRSGQHGKVTRRLNVMLPRPGGLPGDNALQAGVVGLERVVLLGATDRVEIVDSLRAAGIYGATAPTIFGLLRLVGATIATLVVMMVLWQQNKLAGTHWLYPLAGFIVIFISAKAVLRWRVKSRLRRIRRELPFVLDLLVLMLESGVGLDQCFRQMALLDSGGMRLISTVNIQLVDDLQNGMSYEAALERWSERLAVPGARELASLFRQSLLYGTELGPALHIFVHEFSDKRISAARDAIGRKTAQMTVVMILFLLPSLFIVLGGPAVVSITAALHGVR